MRDSRSLVNTKFPIKVANCSPYFTILQVISNLETQKSYKITVNLKNLNFFKKICQAVLKLFTFFLSRPLKMFTKPLTRAPRYIVIKSFFLEIG